MKACYPIILTEMNEGGYLVYVPDMRINTTGTDIGNALEMAKDAIELCGIGYEDEKLVVIAAISYKVPAVTLQQLY